jgi:hypothetical protein
MPVITIQGLPVPDFYAYDKVALSGLVEESIPSAVVSVVELGLEAHQVTVFAVADLLAVRSRLEVIAWVEGLTVKPERTLEVQQQLSDAVAQTLRRFCGAYLPNCQLVEVFVRPFDATISTSTSLILRVEAPFCDNCGHLTVRNGAWFTCLNCGNQIIP